MNEELVSNEFVAPNLRYAWRLRGDTSFKEDPRTCFERTSKETNIKFIGSKEALPKTSIIFSIPTYHREWIQGNLQKQVFEFLNSQVTEETGAIEINYVLNELSEKRKGGNGNTILNEFIIKESDGYEEAIYDFSNMTPEDYLDYRDAKYGKHTPYPDYLFKNIETLQDELKEDDLRTEYKENLEEKLESLIQRTDEIIRTNNEIIEFFTDLSKIQNLGRTLTKAQDNPTAHSDILKQIADQIETYGTKPDLQEIMKLAYSKADQINITLLNTLDADFSAEGYKEKTFPNIRGLGADYVVERTKSLSHQDDVIVQIWDNDLLPSPNFYRELIDHYKKEKVDVTALPVAALTSPGTNMELFTTSINSTLPLTQIEGHYMGSTPQISFNVKVLKELGGISGWPHFEDRELGGRLQRYMLLAHPDQYKQRVSIPAIAVLMHDKPGYVDAANRGTKGLSENEKIDNAIIDYLEDGENFQKFKNKENLENYLKLIEAKAKIRNEIEAKMNSEGLNLNDYLNKHREDSQIWNDNYYSEDLLQHLRIIVNDPNEVEKMFKAFHESLVDYEVMYKKQSQQNRLVVRQIIKEIKSGNFDLQSKNIIKDPKLIPEPLRFPLLNYIQSNSEFVKSLSNNDWQYIEYLVGTRKECPIDSLTPLQQSLREYLGEPIDADFLVNNSNKFIPSEKRPPDNKTSYIYAVSAIQLADTLTTTNFLRNVIDPSPAQIEFARDSVESEPPFADYSDRTQWYTEIFESPKK